MANSNHYILCPSCGHEFKSLFAGAAVAIGNLESCPSCRQPVKSPHLAGDINIDLLNEASSEPMLRFFGENGCDGYVFMGRGQLAYEIREPCLIPAHSAYYRNVKRALSLLETYYTVERVSSQNALGAVFISLMTAYECLIDDTYLALQERGIIVAQKRPSFRHRRDMLLSALGLQRDDHIVSLEYLYAFRNCLAHNAGVIDRGFLANVAKIGPAPAQLAHYLVGDRLKLDALTATSFADSIQQVAHYLLPRAQQVLSTRQS